MGLLDYLMSAYQSGMGLLNSAPPKKSVMDNYQDPKRYIGPYVNPEEPLSAPSIGPVSLDPTDYIGPGTIAKAGAVVKGLLSGAAAKGAMLAPIGMTAWHGSPHKFDKFDMSKIGTGEGAQAYGHGLYMAESPAVAQDYQKVLSGPVNKIAKGQGKYYHITDAGSGEVTIAGYGSSQDQWGRSSNLSDFWDGADEGFKSVDDAVAWLRKNGHIDETATPSKVTNAEFNEWQIPSSGGALYKVDIPDEAVARMLDWDKPLSQQAPEVQKALEAIAPSLHPSLQDQVLRSVRNQLTDYEKDWAPVTGAALYRQIGQKHGGAQVVKDAALTTPQATVSELLQQQGIPGIRYLDGGSRGAGGGTSNFVLFSDQLPRILERNGVPTGQVPWAPGEWQGLLGMTARGITNSPLQTTVGLLDSSSIRANPMIDLYHGSPEKLIKIHNRGMFGGVFASANPDVAGSHGQFLHKSSIPESSIADSADLDSDITHKYLMNRLGISDDEYDAVFDAVVGGKGVYHALENSGIPESRLLEIFKGEDIGDADWFSQRLRGELARENGFKAVTMPDEHGVSYLLLPGVDISPMPTK